MSVSSDMNILFWDMNSFQLITFLKSSHTSFIFSCIELSDRRLITGSDDSSIVIYKKGTYEKITNEDFPSAVFSLIEIKSYTNRKRIAVGCGDYNIYLCYIITYTNCFIFLILLKNSPSITINLPHSFKLYKNAIIPSQTNSQNKISLISVIITPKKNVFL